ncbi:WEB family protein [Populus alba x Populus x berolinensis]|nr:WEB family protein [Populus alba x Populus x berolinensis]
MSSKTKSGLSETPPSKPSPATPRVSQLSRGVAKLESDSLSPLQSSRLSVDRSPRSINSKPTIDRRTPKVTRATPPEKPQTRVVKASELQVQLSHLQEDLKKTKEQLELIEKEKGQALDELKQTKKAAEDANEKLQEAMVAQKRAEENSEIEKFRAIELEQAGIEAAQKKEEEWQKELEDVRSQHALDVTALLSTTQELQRVKQELAMTTDTKNQALSHADDATKIAEIHAEKVEILSAELSQLKVLLDSKLETEANESHKIVLQLKEEIDSMKQQLEKGKGFEDKLIEREAFIEQLNVDLEAAKMAESYACNLVEEWRNRVEELEMQAAEANKLERSASESLGSFMKQLEANNVLLHDAETEMAALKEKVGLLEMTIRRQKGDLEESEHSLGMVKEEALFMEKKVESLMSELETVKEEKAQALNNEKLAASSVQSLLEEKNKIVTELVNARDEEEKSKKAMESLASALHEVSVEAREAKEGLVSNLVEHENYETQIEDLRLVLKATNEKYETVLDDAKHEIELLKKTVEESKNEFKNSKAMWDQKEENLVDSVRKSEEENISLEKEIDRLVNLQKQIEEEACGMRDEEAHLKDSLKEVEAEVISLQEALGEAKVESMKLKESLLAKENELQNIILENKELRTKEASSLKKVEELSKLLEEAMAKIQTVENGELTDNEKDYDLLPKMIEFSEENGHVREEKPEVEELPPQQTSELKTENAQEQFNGVTNEAVQMDAHKIENVNGKPKEDDSVEVEFKMWESCKIEKEFSPGREMEQESFEEKVDSKVDGGESFDQTNGLSSTENVDDGGSSPTKQQQQKKKKPLLRKFGNLLKKKGTSTQK